MVIMVNIWEVEGVKDYSKGPIEIYIDPVEISHTKH